MAARKKPNGAAAPKTDKRRPLFTAETPTDDHGAPLADVEVPFKDGMPLDAESSLVMQDYNNAMAKRTAGERIRWNGPYASRYHQALVFYPNAMVRIRQTLPTTDENIDPRPIAVVNDYSLLIKYIREAHWRGQKATYEWVIYDDRNPQLGTGKIEFQARPEEDMSQQHGGPPAGGPPVGYPPPQPQQQQPWGQAPGYPPAPGYPQQYPQQYAQQPYSGMPSYGMPQQYPQQFGMPMMPPMPPPPPPVAAPAPAQSPPPPPPPEVMMPQIVMPPLPPGAGGEWAGVIQAQMSQIERLAQSNIMLAEQLRQAQSSQTQQQPQTESLRAQLQQQQQYQQMLMQWMASLMTGGSVPGMVGGSPWMPHPAPAAAPAAPPAPVMPPPPTDPIEAASRAMSTVRTLMRFSQQMQNELSPNAEPEPIVPPPPVVDPESPHVVTELPHMRVVHNRDGSKADGTTTLMYNIDKIAAIGGAVFDRFKEVTQEAKRQSSSDLEAEERKLRLQKERLELAERTAANARLLMETQRAMQMPQPPQPPQPPVPPAPSAQPAPQPPAPPAPPAVPAPPAQLQVYVPPTVTEIAPPYAERAAAHVEQMAPSEAPELVPAPEPEPEPERVQPAEHETPAS